MNPRARRPIFFSRSSDVVGATSGGKWEKVEKVIKPATFAYGNPRTRRRKGVG